MRNKKMKITVLRTEYYQDLAVKYAIPHLEICPFHCVGQIFYCDGMNRPEGMCEVAWQTMMPMIRQLLEGKLLQPSGTWLKNDTICVTTCPDGIRPVIFLLEVQANEIHKD